jgi:hypothetical protein
VGQALRVIQVWQEMQVQLERRVPVLRQVAQHLIHGQVLPVPREQREILVQLVQVQLQVGQALRVIQVLQDQLAQPAPLVLVQPLVEQHLIHGLVRLDLQERQAQPVRLDLEQELVEQHLIHGQVLQVLQEQQAQPVRLDQVQQQAEQQ